MVWQQLTLCNIWCSYKLAVGKLILISATDGDLVALIQKLGVEKWMRIQADPARMAEMPYVGLHNVRVLPTEDDISFKLEELKMENRFGRDEHRKFSSQSDDEFLKNVQLADFMPPVILRKKHSSIL